MNSARASAALRLIAEGIQELALAVEEAPEAAPSEARPRGRRKPPERRPPEETPGPISDLDAARAERALRKAGVL